MYRVFDFENKVFLNGDYSIRSNGNLVMLVHNRFLVKKYKEYNRSEYDYCVDLDTGFKDKNGIKIFENDIITLGNITGFVGWNRNEGKYALFDVKEKQWYSLWEMLCKKEAEVIGCVELNPELIWDEDGGESQHNE